MANIQANLRWVKRYQSANRSAQTFQMATAQSTRLKGGKKILVHSAPALRVSDAPAAHTQEAGSVSSAQPCLVLQ
jgi:hypothetical protein